MMTITDFTFETRQKAPTFFETILTAPSGNKFGIIYRSLQPAPDIAIFDGFQKNPRMFFIEVEGTPVPVKKRGKPSKLLTNG